MKHYELIEIDSEIMGMTEVPSGTWVRMDHLLEALALLPNAEQVINIIFSDDVEVH